jgi:hypothetical protein
MKIKYLILPLALILASSVYAKTAPVPFINKLIPEDGLQVQYNMDGKYLQKVVCVFDNFYKGSLTYAEDGVEKAAIPFGNGDDGQQVYFTSKGKTWHTTQGLDDLQQIHVDSRALFTVKNPRYTSDHAYATCFYMPE